MSEQLRRSLCDLADDVEATDLYARALCRSGHLARRRTAAGTGAALVALGVLGGGLWWLPEDDPVRPQPVAAASAMAARPVPGDSSGQAGSAPGAARPRSRALAGLPGQAFYRGGGDVVRLRPAGARVDTVLSGVSAPVGISADGRRIAYVSGSTLLVVDTGPVGDTGRTQAPLPVAHGVTTAGQVPAWSPDGTRLLVHTTVPAVLEIGTGRLTPLPGSLAAGRQFRWSGDGGTLVFATGPCRLAVAGGDPIPRTPAVGTPAVGTPAVGTPVPVPPRTTGACQAGSVDATGRRVAVPATRTGTAVLDTVTGRRVSLPVAGEVLGAVFDAGGNLLVRTRRAGVPVLSLVAPDNTLLVQADEPVAVRGLELLAYTR